MQQLSQPHIESFNYLLTEGLQHITETIRPLEFMFRQARVSISITSLEIAKPRQPGSSRKLFPSECRRSGKSYCGSLVARFQITIDGNKVTQLEQNFGDVPIMVRSRVCNLHGLQGRELIAANEEPQELGGYFIVGGNERVIRMIVLPRRNFPICCQRPSFKKRGKGYTENAVIIRSVAVDQTSCVNILHWRVFGEPVLNFSHNKDQFYAPVALILRALVDHSDMEIYDEILRGSEDSLSLQQTALVMLTRLSSPKFCSREKALTYIGIHFRQKLGLPEWYSDLDVGRFLLNQCILIHLADHTDKFMLLTYMIRKLHAFVREKCCLESNDRAVFQEVMLPGHIYLQLIKEKIEISLLQLRKLVLSENRRSTRKSGVRRESNGSSCESIANLITDLTSRIGKAISRALIYFLATGNLVSRSGFGLMQVTGLVIPLDNINFLRLASNFRALHRGAFFTQMRTTEVRKLLPEVYGFICPVHTPDGPPCGLLNHLSINCRVVNRTFLPSAKDELMNLLIESGLWVTTSQRHVDPELHRWLTVLIDGRVAGWLSMEDAIHAEGQMRLLKMKDDRFVFMEVCLIPQTSAASQYSGLYVFTDVARLMRPVHNLLTDKREWIGTFEQPYLSIAHARAEDTISNWTHQEESAENLFSFVASLTPFPDYNQSPRNMYQCQMGKQTMGHSCYTWRSRSDIKAYRLLTPQTPLLKTKTYDEFDVDTYPLGFNAIVAVLSYSAYDMEDAMVINRASYDRGLAHACIYKSQVVDLMKKSEKRIRFATDDADCSLEFGFGPDCANKPHHFDSDGFPFIGTKLERGKKMYAYFHKETGKTEVVEYKGDQPAFVDAISLNGNRYQATITLRIQRIPDIGDKFSSRHGQKGVNSILMPPQDMPWTDSGMVPDLIFNPHGIPSRMTIGKLTEFLGGKVSALTGKKIDATPFQRDANDPPFYEFMEILKAHGYNHFGTETFYSGSTGEPIEAEVFMGVVYYQRLRHMVADKWQVRSTGGIDFVTRQPTKGRKVGGGVRLGEMERDCLLSHGAPAILNERMFASCSDRSSALMCGNCGSMIDISFRSSSGDCMTQLMSTMSEKFRCRWRCKACNQSGQNLKRVTIPHVLRLLAQELTAMNVRTRFEATQFGRASSVLEDEDMHMTDDNESGDEVEEKREVEECDVNGI